MRWWILLPSALVLACGCMAVGPSPGPGSPAWVAAPPTVPIHPNPVFVPVQDPHVVWENVVDVVDDYFRVMEEEPVRLIGSTVTEGRLATYPEAGATLLEPWRRDSVGAYERLESTLQSIRRHAQVRVTPAQGGYWVDVAVFKELEDAAQPMLSSSGAATFRYDGTLTRVVNPVGEQEINRGWIPYGRDDLLEQRLLGHLQDRIAGCGAPVRVSEVPRDVPASVTR